MARYEYFHPVTSLTVFLYVISFAVPAHTLPAIFHTKKRGFKLPISYAVCNGYKCKQNYFDILFY